MESPIKKIDETLEKVKAKVRSDGVDVKDVVDYAIKEKE